MSIKILLLHHPENHEDDDEIEMNRMKGYEVMRFPFFIIFHLSLSLLKLHPLVFQSQESDSRHIRIKDDRRVEKRQKLRRRAVG